MPDFAVVETVFANSVVPDIRGVRRTRAAVHAPIDVDADVVGAWVVVSCIALGVPLHAQTVANPRVANPAAGDPGRYGTAKLWKAKADGTAE